MLEGIRQIKEQFEELDYIIEEELATILFLLLKLQKPLLLEGHPGVGKTEVAYVLARFLNTELIRLQCHEGLDVNSAVYEWNYQKQLLSIKIQEKNSKTDEEKEAYIFGEDFLLKRPLLQSISNESASPVLLIDEIDRADEEFEAFLLELLSVFQISIPELGTLKAKHKPFVILTSNRTRELGDALKRRCLFHWVAYPDLEKELRIVKKKIPEIDESLANQLVRIVQQLRKQKLSKAPGIAETLDWAQAMLVLGYPELNMQAINATLGCVLKSTDDLEKMRTGGIEKMIEN